MRMRQSISQFEIAFEQETSLGAPPPRAAAPPRRQPLARAAHHPHRAAGKVRFSVLAVCLTVTVVVVVVAMFEALAFLMA